MKSAELRIDLVSGTDAGELLTLRRAAFVSEAQMYDDVHLPALTQTLDELREDLDDPNVITLGSWLGHRLVASIRVGIEGTKANLGRLAVAPDMQGRGIGTQTLLSVQEYLPDTITEIWVFTGQDSKASLAHYAKHGFEHQYDQQAGDLTQAYLRRIQAKLASNAKNNN